ncbi:MAG TPA: OmpH family outer membrane protein [bacterium]|nr:OmpH family outer membrane protein [bacterium]
MRKIIIKMLPAAIAGLAIIFCGNAVAQTAKIGYVDIKEAFSSYEKAKVAEDGFKKEIDEEKKKMEEMEAEIKNLQADFEKKKDILKPEEKTKKEAELREKVQEFYKLGSSINKTLDAKRQKLEEEILEEIKAEIQKYGQKKGFAAILDKRVVFYGQTETDLTQEIIKSLNKK